MSRRAKEANDGTHSEQTGPPGGSHTAAGSGPNRGSAILAELRSLEAHVRRLEAGADEVGTAPEADFMKGVEPDNEIAAVVREIERLERLDHAPEGSTR